MLIGIKEDLHLPVVDVEVTDKLLNYLKSLTEVKEGALWPRAPKGFVANVSDRQEFSNMAFTTRYVSDISQLLPNLSTLESETTGGYLVLKAGVYPTSLLCKTLRALVVAEPEDTSWGVNEATDDIWITPANSYLLKGAKGVYKSSGVDPLIGDVVEYQAKLWFVVLITAKNDTVSAVLSSRTGTQEEVEIRYCKLFNRANLPDTINH